MHTDWVQFFTTAASVAVPLLGIVQYYLKRRQSQQDEARDWQKAALTSLYAGLEKMEKSNVSLAKDLETHSQSLKQHERVIGELRAKHQKLSDALPFLLDAVLKVNRHFEKPAQSQNEKSQKIAIGTEKVLIKTKKEEK